MAKDPSREAHFPLIEKKYGQKMSYWFSVMKDLADEKYPAQYYKTITADQAKTMRSIFKTIAIKYPKSELVIAWNQPMVKIDGNYVFGATAATKHILMSPWSADVIADFAPKMADLVVKKKTIGIPNDWDVDTKLILALVKARLAECK